MPQVFLATYICMQSSNFAVNVGSGHSLSALPKPICIAPWSHIVAVKGGQPRSLSALPMPICIAPWIHIVAVKGGQPRNPYLTSLSSYYSHPLVVLTPSIEFSDSNQNIDSNERFSSRPALRADRYKRLEARKILGVASFAFSVF